MDRAINLVETDSPSTRRGCDPTLQQRIPTEMAEAFANLFKALSHPVRVQMLDLISQGEGETCGCDIERHFALTQPTISHHLKVLREAGLITSESHGVWVHHRVNRQALELLQSLLATMHK
ncbi:MAG: ArsR family transcriptional regulator [Chloroflexi bacterium CFX4]|nr:ArsR family transcriptional regulator [Chloroflexi bacterium CFX4]MDL1924540.1 winged helix-turn-helix transcriptional regulator [Chloroflexi bacterium CFX3]